MTLGIDLQDGFSDDEVMISVDGEVRYRSEEVSTRLLLGVASSFEIEVEPGEVRVEVSVLSRGLEDTLVLQVGADTWLGISVEHDEIRTVVSDRPFGYG